MKIKFNTSKTAILYNLHGNQNVKARNIKSKKNYMKKVK